MKRSKVKGQGFRVMTGWQVFDRPGKPAKPENCPEFIPWDLIKAHAQQCQRNHSQTPDELHGRGGLSPCELLLVLKDEPLSSSALKVSDLEAVQPLVDILEHFMNEDPDPCPLPLRTERAHE